MLATNTCSPPGSLSQGIALGQDLGLKQTLYLGGLCPGACFLPLLRGSAAVKGSSDVYPGDRRKGNTGARGPCPAHWRRSGHEAWEGFWVCHHGPVADFPRLSTSCAERDHRRTHLKGPRGTLTGKMPVRASVQAWPGGHTQLGSCC